MKRCLIGKPLKDRIVSSGIKKHITFHCFRDSYCSWQKGAVENINKLIRQYIPQKSNLNDFSDEYIKNVGRKLNLRPRKTWFFNPERRILQTNR